MGDKIKVNTEEGLGSGVLISDDGLIWTASHVIHSAERIAVKFTDGDVYEAEVLSSSPSADVALIKIIGDFQLKNKQTPFFYLGRITFKSSFNFCYICNGMIKFKGCLSWITTDWYL